MTIVIMLWRWSTIIQSMNINSLPVVYEVKKGTYVIAEITTLFGKINVSIINSLLSEVHIH